MWPSSISEPSVSTARLVVWPSTIEPFLRLGIDQHPAAEARLDARVLATTSTCRARGSSARCRSSRRAAPGRARGDTTVRSVSRYRTEPARGRPHSSTSTSTGSGRGPIRPALPSAWMLSVVPCDSPTAPASYQQRRDMSDPAGSVAYVGDLVSLTVKLGPRRGLRPGHQRGRPGTSGAARSRPSDRRPPRSRPTSARSPAGPTSRTRTTTSAACSTTRASSRGAESLLPARDLRRRRRSALYWFNLGVVLEDHGRVRRGDRGVRARARARAARSPTRTSTSRASSSRSGAAAETTMLMRRAVRHLLRIATLP